MVNLTSWNWLLHYWNGTNSYANVFRVDTNGYLNNANVDWTGAGLRPISFLNLHI